jgi:hemerythrin-like domain-containing protein
VKRHPLLQPLSDDHHRALVLARRTRRAAEASSDAKSLAKTWLDVKERFASELEPHFRVEEAWLFPALEAAGALALVERARADHALLRELVLREAAATTAVELAGLLETHIRFEERELFPLAERLLALDKTSLASELTEAVRQSVIDAALDGYEQAAISGLCHEGAWEAAVSAMRSIALDSVTERVVADALTPLPGKLTTRRRP